MLHEFSSTRRLDASTGWIEPAAEFSCAEQSRGRVRVGGPAPGSGLGGPNRVHCQNRIENGAFYADLGPAAPGLLIVPPGRRRKQSRIGAAVSIAVSRWSKVTSDESLVPIGTVRGRESGPNDAPSDLAKWVLLGGELSWQVGQQRLAPWLPATPPRRAPRPFAAC